MVLLNIIVIHQVILFHVNTFFLINVVDGLDKNIPITKAVLIIIEAIIKVLQGKLNSMLFNNIFVILI